MPSERRKIGGHWAGTAGVGTGVEIRSARHFTNSTPQNLIELLNEQIALLKLLAGYVSKKQTKILYQYISCFPSEGSM